MPSGGVAARTHALDMTGNWSDYTEKTSGSTDLDQDRTHNKVNEITDITETTGTAWVTPAQDKNGNMTTVPKPSSPANGLTLEYDAWNRLVEVKDGATVVGKYEYDGLNRRVKRHLDSDSPGSPDGIDTYVHYLYNAGWQVLETRDTTTESDQPENLQPDYQYAWSGRYIDAPILRDENTDQDSLCDDDRLYYLADANFNVTTLTDTSGDAVERYQYDPYGTPSIYDATWSNTRSTSSYNNTVLYTGRELDPETGLMCYRNRYYHAELGRFASRDPMRQASKDLNLYRYVMGRPPNLVDPSGLESCTKEEVGKRRLGSANICFSPGNNAPGDIRSGARALAVCSGLIDVDVRDQLVDIISGAGGLTGTQIGVLLPQLDWGRLTGDYYGVWMHIQCETCKCDQSWFNFWSEPTYSWYPDDPVTVRCDLTKIELRGNSGNWVAGNQLVPSMLFPRERAAIVLGCYQQAEEYCEGGSE